MAKIRRTVLFTGQVQGVGFRYTTCHVAQRFDVVGFVRNLPDGRVELIAEGETGMVDAFVAGVNQAMSGLVFETETTDAEDCGEFDRFGIRY